MRVFGLAGIGEYDRPVWLRAYDLDARKGRGLVHLTNHRDEALRFASCEDVMGAWLKPSTVQPLRPDGKPNRPLSAFTVSPERYDVVEREAPDEQHGHGDGHG